MLEIIFLILVSGYFIISAALVIGAKKTFPQLSEDKLPSVSVVVAARNEDANILSCLYSLDNLIYPDDKLEIIIIDDASSDNTLKISSNFIHGKLKFRVIHLDENDSAILKGKVRAMAEGVKIANGEIILTTDADCTVHPLWAKTIASYYVGKVGVVNGFTSQTVKDSFSGMQAIDFIYLLFIASGTINLGKPVSCIGNNMSFRKKAYVETGGFENLPFSVTEDFLLLNSIHKLKNYVAIYPMSKDSVVTSKPAVTFQELFNQKKRWAVGGIDTPPIGIGLMLWAFLTNLFILLTPFFFSAAWLYLVIFKIAIDFFVLLPVHQRLGLQKNLKYFPVFQIYYLIYVVVLPFVVLLSKKVKWKDRVY
ncbi:MAG: glycosyltransferase [Ignavibacteriaceae bacterium]|nr:glycosyltransferase [Ignavibacteriaceae bacterium]